MRDLLLKIKDLHIEGKTGDTWVPIVKGVDLELNRGEVLGLIGESGAGKSTLGLAAMGFTHDGCRIASGSIEFDGMDVLSLPDKQRRLLRGDRISYVAQSAAANFNPAHKLIDQYAESPVVHGIMTRAQPTARRLSCSASCVCPTRKPLAFGILIRFQAASCNGP